MTDVGLPTVAPLSIVEALWTPTTSDALAWTAVLTFAVGGTLLWADRERVGRTLTAGAWVAFGVFWLSVFPRFAFEMYSVIEGLGSLIAVPLCLHAAYLTYRGHDELATLSRAMAVMGLLYLPVETIPVVRRTLIEAVATQAHAVMSVAGFDPQFTAGPDHGYRNRFVFPVGDTHYSTYIVTACTGIGSIAIFGGLVAAVRAPLRRKVVALVGAVSVIWVLNVFRNAFISVAYGHQWFSQGPLVAATTALTGESAGYTSFFVADRVLAQGLSVVALVGITVGVLRVTPELLSTLEAALYVATRREIDLADTLGIDPPDPDTTPVADGGPGVEAGDRGRDTGDDPGEGRRHTGQETGDDPAKGRRHVGDEAGDDPRAPSGGADGDGGDR